MARVLNTNSEDIKKALCYRVVAARGEVMEKGHNVKEAYHGRDALAKAMYDHMFSWIVSRINDIVEVTDAMTHGKCTVIGVLDIYGFEIFDNNSFEQFCINYCNEKLQQLFIELVLKQEQEEYEREGIKWVHVDYFNNQIICDLVEQNHKGVISIMDEACLNVGKVTDVMLIKAMDQKLGKHDHYTSRQTNPSDKTLTHERDFRIKHYAGDVVYCIDGFIDKNKDTLYQDFKRLLYNCGHDVLKEMWPEGSKNLTAVNKRPPTAATLFKTSMVALVEKLKAKESDGDGSFRLKQEPFYVRCVKPNEVKSASFFDEVRISHQVSYLGLLENLRVRRAGFVHRQPYQRFLQRYKAICSETWPTYNGSVHDGVKTIVSTCGFGHDVEYGKTKIFIRTPKTLFELEDKRTQAIDSIVRVLQRCWRGFISRRFVKRKRATRFIFKCYCAYRSRSYLKQIVGLFSNVRQMKDHGKAVVWPKAPINLQSFIISMKKVHLRWWAHHTISRIPQERHHEIRLKCLVYSVLHEKRKQWGFSNCWTGNYLCRSDESSQHEEFERFTEQMSKTKHQEIVFSSLIKKINLHDKEADRIIVCTNKAIYKLDYKFKILKHFAIKEIKKISISPGSDQLVILHHGSNDFVFCLYTRNQNREDRVAELLANIMYQAQQGDDKVIEVNVDAKPHCTLGRKNKAISIQTGTGSQPSFKKNDSASLTLFMPA